MWKTTVRTLNNNSSTVYKNSGSYLIPTFIHSFFNIIHTTLHTTFIKKTQIVRDYFQLYTYPQP